MGLTRRKFMGVAFVGTALLALAPYAYYKSKTGKGSEIVLAILQRRLGYLNIELSVFQTYANDYLEFRKGYKSQLAHLAVIAFPLRFITPYSLLDSDSSLVRLEDNVVSNFLLSTNFFHPEYSATGVVKYVGFYDPVARPCRNPFFTKP